MKLITGTGTASQLSSLCILCVFFSLAAVGHFPFSIHVAVVVVVAVFFIRCPSLAASSAQSRIDFRFTNNLSNMNPLNIHVMRTYANDVVSKC